MAEAVFSFIVERLGDLLIEEARSLQGVDGQVQQIHNELRWMQAFLKDADARQHEEQRIRVWVSDVRALAYDAGDVLESFLLGVVSKRRGGMKSILKRYVCILNECVVLHKAGSEMQGIKTRIFELKSCLETYGIRSLPNRSCLTNETQSQLRRSFPHVSQDDFVGLEGDVENLVAHLVNDRDGEKYYQVVSIYGMGGLGKTTLAQKIYNHPNVKHHFGAFAWVCISQQWQTKEILLEVLSKLLPEQRDQLCRLREDELIEKLFEVQQNKICLVVLDDIWSKDAWDCLKPAFRMGKGKSKLLLTSRNTEVATHVDPECLLHKPRFLSEDECWELLKKKAFTRRDQRGLEDAEKMEKLGKEMVRCCGGLPLAVIVLGGLLITKQSLREWEKVHQSIKSYIRSGDRDHQRGVLEILALSYNELPYQLKPCFLYLGKFSEDSEIKAERLYQRWIAESMVRSEDQREGETMMDVAECYLAELAQRCMVQVSVRRDESEHRKFKSCRLHDLMRDLCLFKAEEEDFFHVIDFRQQNDHKLVKPPSFLTNRTRRLVIYFDQESNGSAHSILDKETSKHLRSLLFTNVSRNYMRPTLGMVKSHLMDFKLLRVLAIEGQKIRHGDNEDSFVKVANVVLDLYKLPKLIGKLIYLRYLSLRRTYLLIFPSSITNLKQLQTLDLRGYISIFLPCMQNVLQKTGKLRHLYLPGKKPSMFKESKLRLAGLSRLETLENFNPSWCNIEDLFKLSNLQKLTAKVFSNDKGAERMVDYLTSLDQNQFRHLSLSIFFEDFCGDEWRHIIMQLLGCASIHALRFWGIIATKLPGPNHGHHFNFSPSLTKLTLYGSKLNEDPMPTLENLPKLRILGLKEEAYVGTEMNCSATGFPQLRYLKLKNLLKLKKWGIHEGALPNLARLKVVNCRELEKVPDGLIFISTLKELEIIRMPMEFKKRLCIIDGDEGEDFKKIQHVPSILIKD